MVDKRSVGKIADTPTYRQNLGSLKTCDIYFISPWIGLGYTYHNISKLGSPDECPEHCDTRIISAKVLKL